MGVRNEVHASMEVYVKTHISHPLNNPTKTYFGWSRAHFGQVGGGDSAEVEVVAAAAVEPGAVGGPAVVVVAAAELPAVAAGISIAAAAG